MKDRFLKNARHEYSFNQCLVMMLCLAPIFLLGLPYAFVALGIQIDRNLQWPSLWYGAINIVAGCLLSALGWLFGLWSIYSQLTIGRGTPVPLMATQKLVVQPPYTYCRNPMALGTIAAYLGIAIVFGSIGAIILTLLFSGALLVYIRRVEEREMELRFGQEYLEYRQRTPFLFPRFCKA